jgi:hypothetical protein
MAQKSSLKRMYFFSRYRFATLAFSGAIRLGIVLIFTARIQHTSMHLWKQKSDKKIFFAWETGNPLKRVLIRKIGFFSVKKKLTNFPLSYNVTTQ